MIQFPEKKYSIIYADPPWSYNDKARAGKRGAEFKYSCMSLDDIEHLPIADITEENAVLFMWVTMPMLGEGLAVLQAWGFDYKTVAFTWVKRNKVNPVGWFTGMGNWTRANPELVLLGVKGKPKRISASVHSVVESPLRGHSQKPPEVRQRIVSLMGDLPRIELFARETVWGWDAWGNEVQESLAL